MKSILFLIAFISLPVHAFIPRAQFILKQNSDLSGKGAYQIERTVHFREGINTFQLRETWIIDGENSLKVTVRNGNQVIYQALFLGEKRYDADRAPRGEIQPDSFYEKYFMVRQPRKWLEDLVRMKVLQSDSLQARVVRDTKEYKYVGDSNVRLARSQGNVTFALGATAPENSPGFWFNQENFQLVRMRLPSGAEVRAERAISSGKNLSYPGDVAVTWQGKSVDIRTKSIEPLKNVGKNFDPNTLSNARWDTLVSTSLKPVIEEFYSRFR